MRSLRREGSTSLRSPARIRNGSRTASEICHVGETYRDRALSLVGFTHHTRLSDSHSWEQNDAGTERANLEAGQPARSESVRGAA